MEARYVTSATSAEQMPAETLPEFAFIGRSNCGKSSLLNAIVNQKSLARHSSTPGRTQMVNIFSWGKDCFLIDLPGYGFSAASVHVSKHWQDLVDSYLQRSCIKLVLFLIDMRREADEIDLALLRQLQRQHRCMMVLTKADKLNQAETLKATQHFNKILEHPDFRAVELFTSSSLKKTNIPLLRETLLKLATELD